MWQKIKQLNEERGQALADMKSILSNAETEKRDINAEEDARFNELSSRAEAIKVDVERRQKLYAVEQDVEAGKQFGEARKVTPGRGDVSDRRSTADADTGGDDEADEHRSAINRYLHGKDRPGELRSLTIADAGGVVGDRPMYQRLIDTMKGYDGVRQAGATVLRTTDGNDLTIQTLDDTGNVGAILAEAACNDEELDPELGSVVLRAIKFDTRWIKVSIELLQDAAFDVEGEIIRVAGERIGRTLNRYTTVGTGVGQPRGFLTAGTLGKVAAAANAIAYEEVLDLVHTVDSAYRESGSFRLQFHDSTLAALRKLKDGNGSYIFAAGAMGAPATILDYPYICNNAMPQLSDGSGAKVVAAGDFSRYYLRDVVSPTVVRAEELFIGCGLIGFRMYSRHDGNLADPQAVKFLQLA